MAVAHIFNLIFNCTPAQFATAMSTTLPGAGFGVIQAPNKFNGLIKLNTVVFTGTTSTATTPTVITGVSSVAGLALGMPISGTGIAAGAVITAIGTNTVTMSIAASATEASTTITATGIGLQVDFTYDGNYFLRFFGANPVPTGYAEAVGVVSNNLVPTLISYLTSSFAATLGAPISSAYAVPPPFDNSGPY